MGSNPQAAVFYGLDRRRVVLGAYVVTGLLTGLAAYLFGARATNSLGVPAPTRSRMISPRL